MAVVNSKHLIEAKREIAIPFELRLQLVDGDTVSMTIVEIFRLLPGKRIVARAKYKGGDVLAIHLGEDGEEFRPGGVGLLAAACGVRQYASAAAPAPALSRLISTPSAALFNSGKKSTGLFWVDLYSEG